MFIDEDTGESVVCPICYDDDFWNCGDLVAVFDRNRCQCRGGAVYGRLADFSSAIKGIFSYHLKLGSSPKLEIDALPLLWAEAKTNYRPGEEIVLDQDILQILLINLLRDAGALQLPGSIIESGGPGETSSMSLIFSDDPQAIVDEAISKIMI